MNFQQRKKDVLAKLDKSSIGSWDKNIVDLCEKINSLKNYYTTSSCSGRIILIKDEDEKRNDLFVRVWHDLISLKDLRGELEKIMKYPPNSQHRSDKVRHRTLAKSLAHPKDTSPVGSEINGSESEQVQDSSIGKVINGKITNKISDALTSDNARNLPEAISSKSIRAQRDKLNIKFKQEPCILHVACVSLEDAQKLLDKAKLVGWKRSGIISTSKNIMIELISTEKLEFPIISDGRLLIDDEFLKVVALKANENLKKTWKKIEELRKLV